MFNFFKKEKEPENLKEVINQFKNLDNKVKIILEEIESLKKENKFSFKKIGVVRYNPFSEVGGNQSFSVALLDGNNNGIVITSLYSRDGNRVYAKPIENGRSEYSLSNEEKKAILEAIESKQNNNEKNK